MKYTWILCFAELLKNHKRIHYLKIILFMWILCRIMWGLHNNVITTYTDLMTRRFILAAIWNKIYPASIRKVKRHFASTRSRHEVQKCIFCYSLFLYILKNFKMLWNKITVYLCFKKWQCYDMRLNSSLTETLLWAEGGESWANNGQQDHQEK